MSFQDKLKQQLELLHVYVEGNKHSLEVGRIDQKEFDELREHNIDGIADDIVDLIKTDIIETPAHLPYKAIAVKGDVNVIVDGVIEGHKRLQTEKLEE